MRCCIILLFAAIAMLLPLPFSGAGGGAPMPGMLLTVNSTWQQLAQGDTTWQTYCRYVSHVSGVPFHRVAAMWAYETDWGRSRLWRKHRNPAGIRHNAHARKQGATGVWSNDEGGTVKASYPSLVASADNYAWVLRLRRYQPCHCLNDELAFWRCMRKAGWFSGPHVHARARLSEKLKNE
ncbi:MAG: hypothetical protein D6746_05180 [Bacteroidetes bacterium]|nr:MAG: hypothetical protein D6746_05180 [Bacteroidota bacterium]